MLTHRLTVPAHRLAALVEDVLAGQPAEHLAAQAGIDTADLLDAIETFRTAGNAALRTRHDDTWFHARIRPTDWADAENLFSEHVGPRLDGLDGRPAWWYIRKHPDWRIRIRTRRHQDAAALLDQFTNERLIAGWTQGVYEAETAAFGGPAGVDIIHDLFCADSSGILAYLRLDPPPLGRRELSLLLLRTLQDHAGLDPFEAADVFDRIAAIRPAPGPQQKHRVDNLANHMLPLLLCTPTARDTMFAPDGPLHAAADWKAAAVAAGNQLGEAAVTGRLDRGLRATIAQATIFHWNRLGLTAPVQGLLARAATHALLSRD
ncbi:thiopeptide-type bacteriocin biosynthesis protein [Longispora sp. NPDC051575]|uniref:thiopeptide-type bacteriocin biosynthesis protein n=1 Tax=Longispora sp. NPDC051575 TaxID=3154943 RepID=UPI00341FE0F8